MRTQSSQHTEEALKGIMMPLDSMEEMVICSGRGGGNGANDGGSDWGDGEGNLAGHGPGEDISSYVLTGWTLSPCTGGTYYMNGAEYIEGAGGGGGVLINGEGPAADKHTARDTAAELPASVLEAWRPTERRCREPSSWR